MYMANIFFQIFMNGLILGKISDKSDSEWYIKTHPYEANFEKGYTIKIINNLLKNILKLN